MLGLSAGILLLINQKPASVGIQYAGIITGSAGLVGLFLIRRYLLTKGD